MANVPFQNYISKRYFQEQLPKNIRVRPPGNPLVAVEITSGASLLICTLLFSSMWRSFLTVL